MNKVIAVIILTELLLVMAPAVFAETARGQGIYMNFCAPCHASGVAGAPKVGDQPAWSERNTKGVDALVKNAIDGYRGKNGVMPPKGGNSALTDEEVSFAVMYMLEQSR